MNLFFKKDFIGVQLLSNVVFVSDTANTAK